ncbi:myb-like protein I [Amyelois transitella]|uniref:myb-like protein I n=1 Tax=Amyelois transitella TaxID=680683 RepID=UPI00298FCB15|nr:myb-like protein I [Amyelois transitella]
MDESAKNSPCKVCNDGADEAQLRAEVEHLRQHLAERDAHILALEGEFIKSTTKANNFEEQLNTWREKYERLYDSHKRVQKLNQVLEEKLLQMVDKMKGEKSQLTKDIATLSVRLAESKHNYSMLQKENERYKNDMNLAIQLLQCKPDNFVSQKLDNLSVDTQARVSQYVMSKTSKPSSSSQSKNGNENDTFDASEYEFNISASLMSKILEDSIQDTVTKHCDTCTCSKSQNKPFCYNESYYSVATQTFLSGEMKNSLCLSCNGEIKSMNSNLSIRSGSPHGIKLLNEKTPFGLTGPLYIVPQHVPEIQKDNHDSVSLKSISDKIKPNHVIHNHNIVENITMESKLPLETVSSNIEEAKQMNKNTSVNMEPAVHHKLCDRTKSLSSKKSSIHSVGNEDFLVKDTLTSKEHNIKNDNQIMDNRSGRKNSQSSMGAISRTSSLAKSTVSTHKSNTQIGPGPRFCHLRMQAGSKNILLDNAEPDLPPVLYRRQSKCNENSIFKDLADDLDHFIDNDKNEEDMKINNNVVIESTLIDVHVDSNNKDTQLTDQKTGINPVLLNVSSSPLQPLKTHTFSNSSEHNNNNSRSIGSQQNNVEVDNLLNDFTPEVTNVQNNNTQSVSVDCHVKHEAVTPVENNGVKIFNFDRYEQNKIGSQFNRPLRKIDMSQLHSIENTKISKDRPPQTDGSKLEKKVIPSLKAALPAVVNVYPNLTQTHLKVNEHKKVFTNEQSTSSLSSDDSAAMLQKQQLLRVAEWVEKNLEQQNSYSDPLEDEVSFNNRSVRRDSKVCRLTETLNELALNMPHPVSKYSKSYSREGRTWPHVNNKTSAQTEEKPKKHVPNTIITSNVVKETIFPVESGEATVTENKPNMNKVNNIEEFDVGKELREALKSTGDKEITAEDLARMEYNVKKFLLSGPHWANPGSVGRSRRTSSKTETDV